MLSRWVAAQILKGHLKNAVTFLPIKIWVENKIHFY